MSEDAGAIWACVSTENQPTSIFFQNKNQY